MVVRVYGKPDCKICKAAKKKLQLLGVDYQSLDFDATVSLHDSWRADNSAAVLAAYRLHNERLPIIFIDDRPYDYPGAMRELKTRRSRGNTEETSTKIDRISDA
ncbi:hypothetical protein LCGC14_0858460 [marine sediment metagenome]|uniref:Glutaredoxin domain-containing protein n=1 Tax=marine sediment metagenome TaxID=412755 RepID=A0A0F9PCZ7_9ZZZZ